MRVLVLGVTGMLGNTVFRSFAGSAGHEVWGTLRDPAATRGFLQESATARILSGIDVLQRDALVRALNVAHPDVVINCVGLIKQLSAANDPLTALPVNALLPHRLANLCLLAGARLIHVSTDCVFSGRKGNYTEEDPSDAEDLYGKSKYIGELHALPHALTLRTSIIGHELSSRHGLVEWFLAQQGQVRGYARAMFSGLPTAELARVIRDVILPRPDLHGLYHVGAEPISKLDLLRLIARTYQKNITILPDDSVAIDRSLDSRRFLAVAGYIAPEWPDLVELMHSTQH